MSFPIKINEIFTPRNPDVNSKMYVSRPDLEKCLYRSIEGSMHSFLFGESGNGKSWLYKKVFSEKNINYVVANCANASRKKSITDEIYAVCINPGSVLKNHSKKQKQQDLPP
jgi:ABC-type ATPase involved in cell division